ncbi:hypothetical protein [Clostridium sp.]|uniref:hypothetical protein n=1 Tax=Clostridium sp. TaxID=1506 RepID=UPI001A498741|nr:hypothetical protein [Clostridium sp.]MBK5239863.1 hypothetical protein [Clostridium sp.]
MRESFNCEKCEMEFNSKEECQEHEKECGLEKSFTCMKCGKILTWKDDNSWGSFTENECWDFNLGQAGYGSGLDGCNIHIQVCDDCLREWINSFTFEGQEHIINSGSNIYMSTENWIKEAKGEFTDEEYENNGMYSPRQIKAYEDKFPKCDHVVIKVYNDSSAGSGCLYGAHGEGFGNTGLNISSECFNCDQFKERAKDKIIEVKDANYDGKTPIELIEAHKQKQLANQVNN